MGLGYAVKRLKFRKRCPEWRTLQDAAGDGVAVWSAAVHLSQVGSTSLALVPSQVQWVYFNAWACNVDGLDAAGMTDDKVADALALGYLSGRIIIGDDPADRHADDLQAVPRLTSLWHEFVAAEQIGSQGGQATGAVAAFADRLTGGDRTRPAFTLAITLAVAAQALAALEAHLLRSDGA